MEHSKNGQLSAEALDLIDFATAVYHLDRICLRGQREQWIRNIKLRLSLRNHERFNEIADDLSLALGILGGDNFSFEVSGMEHGQTQRRAPTRRVRSWGALTDVALFRRAAVFLAQPLCYMRKKTRCSFVLT